eukprot:CAMPEP_0177155656 /NCGR_PEP_ID=MMETSP0367-20130122/2292_1 /TAXON_ID=447022 ORGANISM="Scrippsiella hangoei-like, Strain SHHI-4" /NCGR_SAMPLE_ID=MMETSP0367 /ASSEMBLY_ACC=CAM_ASM_000362 /LENGTH=285 /DNA_ID=CAMNT_0018601023 /DNA_START=77 /DNA_END=934 /DNA_ORIENTATION=-
MPTFQSKLDGQWKDFDAKENETLEAAFLSGQNSASFNARGQEYVFDFSQMVQRNAKTGREREIRVVGDATRPKPSPSKFSAGRPHTGPSPALRPSADQALHGYAPGRPVSGGHAPQPGHIVSGPGGTGMPYTHGHHTHDYGGHGGCAPAMPYGASPAMGAPTYGAAAPVMVGPGYGCGAAQSYGATPGCGAAPAYGTPAYGSPAYGTPAYGAPAYGAPAYGAPAYGAPAYGAPAYGTPAYGTPAYGHPAPAPGVGATGAGMGAGGLAVAALAGFAGGMVLDELLF